MCGAAQHYRRKCGWGCKRKVKAATGGSGSNSYAMATNYWNGLEKFFLISWTLCGEVLSFIIFPLLKHII